MSQPPRNNPAARLHAVLARARAQADNVSALDRWSRTFGLSQDVQGKAEVLRRGAELMVMASEIRRRVEALPHPVPPAFMNHYSGVESCLDHFTVIARVPMSEFMQAYSPHAEQTLVMCDYALSRDDPDHMPSDEELDDLDSRLGDLIAEIEQTDELDEETRTFILDRLEEVRRAVAQVPDRGVGPAREAINVFIGEVIVNPAHRETMTKTKSGNKVIAFLLAAGLMLVGSASDSLVDQALSSDTVHHAIEGVVRTVTSPEAAQTQEP